MSETTGIEWTDHTGGPYLGCTPVSPGCAHCYAWELAEVRLEHIFRKAYKAAGFADWETRPVWGDHATRVLTKGFWHDARRLNARHKKAGTRGRWFPSLIDWLDEMPAGIIDQEGNALDPVAVLAGFLALVRECDHIDWLLLTKRPENFKDRMMAAYEWLRMNGSKEPWKWVRDWLLELFAPSNIWIGATIENQNDKRMEALLRIPARVRFLSCEPLLGPVDLKLPAFTGNATRVLGCGNRVATDNPTTVKYGPMVDWVICGGESGAKARPMHPDWARSLRDQCAGAGVAFFFKQWGEWRPSEDGDSINLEIAALSNGYPLGKQRGAYLVRVGKKAAGRLLDGREHNDFPEVPR